MTTPTGYRLIDLPRERSDDFFAVDAWAFALPEAETAADGLADAVDWSRSRGVEATETSAAGASATGGADLAAVHSSYGYTMRVQGGTVATSGLTWVGVHPGHRRRGLLTAMIGDHFRRSLARGEVVSTLFAAETTIYQRFGYGLACPTYRLTLPRGATFREVKGSDDLRIRLEDASAARHAEAVRAVLARDRRPGAMTHIGDALIANLFFDPEGLRDGAERARIAIVEDGEGPAAFALFHRKLTWGGAGPTGTGECGRGWAAVDAAAERRLWSVLTDLDLMTTMGLTSVALDSPVVHLLDDVRAPVANMRDQVWARILDVPAALTARSYSADADATIEVTDTMLPENARAWHVAVRDGRASVTPADGATRPDVRMSIQELSVAYLGGTTLDALATAGLVEELTEGAVSSLSDAFRGRMAPRSSLHF